MSFTAKSERTIGTKCYYTYQVDNQSIAIPENIDAIRALAGSVKGGQDSIRMTDESLGIKRHFISRNNAKTGIN